MQQNHLLKRNILLEYVCLGILSEFTPRHLPVPDFYGRELLHVGTREVCRCGGIVVRVEQ